MGILKRLKMRFQEFEDRKIAEHYSTERYGNFTLTDAVRPVYNTRFCPQIGFKQGVYFDFDTGVQTPYIEVSLSKENLFDIFIDLIKRLIDDAVDVSLVSRHKGIRREFINEEIDTVILLSTLYDFEDFLINDGYTGIAVSDGLIQEVDFDDNKTIIIYSYDTDKPLEVLEDYNVPEIPDIEFINGVEHVHFSSDDFENQFEQLKYQLGVDY